MAAEWISCEWPGRPDSGVGIFPMVGVIFFFNLNINGMTQILVSAQQT
jgi:hypothetical protein